MANVHVKMIEDANGDLADIEYYHGYCAPADAAAWPAHESLDYLVYCEDCKERIEAIGLTEDGAREAHAYGESDLYVSNGKVYL